jgi:hypothetical protein
VSPPTAPPPDRLHGWGEIATYLGCDVRTAQRWEKQQGLPVHRNDGPKPRVWAFKSDIDAWWKRNTPAAENLSKPPRPAHLRRLGLWFAVPILGAVILVPLTLTRPKPPAFIVPDRIFARAEAEGGKVRTVAVGGQPFKLALSPDGKYLYVFDINLPNEVQVIDPGRFSVVQSLPVRGATGAIAFSEGGRTIYLGTLNNGLHIIERDTLHTKAVRDGIATKVHDMVMTPDDRHLFLALETGGLKRYDIRNHHVATVWTDRCPEFLALDPAGRYLYVSTGCGPGRSTAHDTIEVMDLASESTVRILRGPPMVTPALNVFPQGDRLWATGLDACLNPAYRPFAPDCPEFPGTIDNVFRLSDGSFAKVSRPHARFLGGPALIIPDGTRAIVGGMPPRVLDTTFYQDQETFGNLRGDAVPVLDARRRRLYVAGILTGRVYGIDLPATNCDPPAPGRVHFWTGDGTPNDKTDLFPLSVTGQVPYGPGLVGRAFDLTNGSLEMTTPYGSLEGFTYRDGAVEGWVKLSGPEGGTIAEFQQNGQRIWTLSIGLDRRPVFVTHGSTPLVSEVDLTPNAWHHFALVRRNTDARLLIDGLHPLKIPASTIGDRGQSTLRFGSFSGLLDEVGLYERPLTDAEIHGIIATTRTCLTGTPR